MSIKVSKEEPDRGVIWRTYDNSGLKPHAFMPTAMHGLSRLMYQMYCSGSILVLDGGTDVYNYELEYTNDCD